MDNIIKFSMSQNNKEWKTKMNTLDTLVKDIEVNNKTTHQYSLYDAEKIAEKILLSSGYYNEDDSVPIIKIVKDFGFKAYKETLDDDLSGDIYINGNTFEEYGHCKVIVVNRNDEFYHQRFVIAHELGHYLFDFLGKTEFADPTVKFTNTYRKNEHMSFSEQIANRFAASILMPENAFIKQYNIAHEIDSSRMFIIMYLSRFFETTIDSIEKRIWEVTH